MLAFINGMTLCAGLVISIGPQNAELLRLGLSKYKAVFILATIYILADILLIFLGVAGTGLILSSYKKVIICILVGAVFLLYYLSYGAFKRSLNPELLHQVDDEQMSQPSNFEVIRTGLALSFLNPLALLDTVIIIGGVASEYLTTADKIAFTTGAICMSFMWFYGMANLALGFSGIFLRSKRNQQYLEGLIGLVLLITAIFLTYKLVFKMM